MTMARQMMCVLVCLLAGGLYSASAAGQQILQEAKVAEGQLTAAQTQSVRGFAEAWVGRLDSDDLAEVIAARDAILREFNTPGITESFREAFSVEVSGLMGDAVRSESDLVRINAMIIATELTNAGATGLIDAGLADENAAVQYWGAKAYLQRVQRAATEEGPAMSADAQRAVIEKVQQVFAGDPSPPVARVGVEILSGLEAPEGTVALLAILNGRVAGHAENPQTTYLPEQAAVQLLSAKLSRERRPDTGQVVQLARAAYRYFVLINSHMQADAILEDAIPGHQAMMDWCYKCLIAMAGKLPNAAVSNDAEAINEQIRRSHWDDLATVAERWHGALTEGPFDIPAQDLE